MAPLFVFFSKWMCDCVAGLSSPPYSVREGGSRLCFVQDPDGYRIELIGRS